MHRYLYHIINIFTAKSCVHFQPILWISNDCVGFSTSQVLSLPRQSEIDWTATWKGIVARECWPRLSPAGSPSTTASAAGGGGASVLGSRQWAAGSGHRRETIAGNNPFLLHVAVHVLQGVKAKVPFPPRQSRIASARFIPNAISSYWGTIGRLGELILMLENLMKWNFHAMGPLIIALWNIVWISCIRQTISKQTSI